jgi:hypothetical protein
LKSSVKNARDVGSGPCQLERAGAAETITDRRDFLPIRALVRLEQIERGGESRPIEGAVALVFPGLLADR